MKRPFLCAALMSLLMLVCGCVHEFPNVEEPEVVRQPVTVHLSFDYEMPPYRDLLYENGVLTSRTASEEYDARYYVGFYMAADARAAASRVPDDIQVITRDDISELGCDLVLDIPEGPLTVMVWTDYVLQGTTGDLHYNADDFAAIAFSDPYVGNTDMRDAFRGCTECTISPEGGEEIWVEMRRPMAKYKFIATDYELFLSRAEARARAEAARAGDDPDEVTVDIDDYTVRIVYPGFLPNVYNMFTDKPADACTGVCFESKIVPLSDGTAALGFDYVLVNGDESLVTVAVQIWDKQGQLVSGTESMNVPLQRSMLTTVSADFMTQEASGGVGISPGFNGEFNIYIQ
ncbi:MAG: hypothetical protein LUD17_08720 [Bacteroidales bacterium]|nr:hypothetical protein [Bacteroidales bacterium]